MIVGELQKEFIAGLEKDLNRLESRLWDEYSLKILSVSNWYERYWLRREVKRLRLEQLKVLGATLQLDEDAAREMMGLPDYKKLTPITPPSPSVSQLSAMAQSYAQSQAMNSQLQAQQGYAGMMNSNSYLGRP